MRLRAALVIMVLAACGRPAPTWPACFRTETGDRAGGLREFQFDAAGNLVAIIDRENAGKLLEHTQLEWTATTIVETSVAAAPDLPFRTPLGRGTLGAHGELLTWSLADTETTLVWSGRFAPGEPRAAHETPYLKVLPQHVSLDTRNRTLLSRMRPFVFDGTVTITRTRKGEEPRVVEADYRDGRLIEMRYDDTRTAATWRGSELVRFADATVEMRDGRIHTWSDPRHTIEFRYDGSRFAGFRDRYRDGEITLDVTACP